MRLDGRRNSEDAMNCFQLVRLGRSTELNQELRDDNVDTLNNLGQNLLHEAIAFHRLEIAEMLVQRGIAVNQQDNEGRTPLHYAGIHRSEEICTLLIRNGATLDITDRHGNTPLWCAVFNAKGHYKVSKLLVDAGADPNHKNNYNKSPLDFARQIGDSQLVLVLDK